MSNQEFVDFSNTDFTENNQPKQERLPYFESLKHGEKARIAFIMFNVDDEGNKFPAWHRIEQFSVWDNGIKPFKAPEDPEIYNLCKTKLGKPTPRFYTLILRYKTNNKGELLGSVDDYEIVTFNATYTQCGILQGIHNAVDIDNITPISDLSKVDLIVQKDATSHMLSFTPQPKCAAQLNEEKYAETLAAANEIKDNDFDFHCGFTLYDEKIKIMLGVEEDVPTQPEVNPFNQQAPVNQVGDKGANTTFQPTLDTNDFTEMLDTTIPAVDIDI